MSSSKEQIIFLVNQGEEISKLSKTKGIGTENLAILGLYNTNNNRLGKIQE